MAMARAENTAAIAHMRRIYAASTLDPGANIIAPRLAAVIVILEDAAQSYQGPGGNPLETLPGLKCAIQILDRTRGVELGPAREHISAAYELLSST